MKKNVYYLLFYLFVTIYSFSNSEKYLKMALENIEYKCNPTQKTIKFEGIDFIGHLNENGKPYGEWYLKGSYDRQCFLENEQILNYKSSSLLIKENETYSLYYSYGYENIISLFIKNKNKSYMYKKIKGKYKQITNLAVLYPALPIYPDMVRIFN